MNQCTTCGAEFEGKICPKCGERAVKAATRSALRTKHAMRLLHSLLLIAFGAIVIWLMTFNAITITTTVYGVTTQTTVTSFEYLRGGINKMNACTLFLLIFAICAILYGILLFFTEKLFADFKYTPIMYFYIPMFVIMCVLCSYIRRTIPIYEETVTETGEIVNVTQIGDVRGKLELGNICIFVLTVGFALLQLALLLVEAHIEHSYAFEDREAALAEKLGAPPVVPYPEIPRSTDYSAEGWNAYYAKRSVFHRKVDEHNVYWKKQRAFRKKLICALYENRYGRQASYPLAYLWWNFSA